MLRFRLVGVFASLTALRKEMEIDFCVIQRSKELTRSDKLIR